MRDDIYSEKVYLTGNQEAVSEITRRKRKYLNDAVSELTMYSKFFKEYDEYMSTIADFLSSLDLRSSLEYSLALAYMVENGYLSKIKNKKESICNYLNLEQLFFLEKVVVEI